MTDPKISEETLTPQPFLFVRKQIEQAEIATALGECLPAVFAYCQQNEIAMAGPPLTRYVDQGPGPLTIEGGIPIAAATDGAGEIQCGTLPGGPAVVALHVGPYDTLAGTYEALQMWMADNGKTPAGSPWELYLTDPGEVADPNYWQTRVVWPVSS